MIHHEWDVREEQKYIYAWREQAIIREIASVISIVACCHGAKLCAHAAHDFQLQQSVLSPIDGEFYVFSGILIENKVFFLVTLSIQCKIRPNRPTEPRRSTCWPPLV